MYGSVSYDRRNSLIQWSEYDENNVRTEKSKKWVPDFYVSSKEETGYTNGSNKHVKRVVVKKFGDRRSKINSYKESLFDVYGSDLTPELKFILEYWPNDIENKITVNTCFLDIECESEDAFPFPDTARERVNAITLYSNRTKIYYVLGLEHKFITEEKDVKYIQCVTEGELLEKFLDIFHKERFDIVTGWNSSGFDIPYMFNRILRVLDGIDVDRQNELLELALTAEGDKKREYTTELQAMRKKYKWINKWSIFNKVVKTKKLVKDTFTKQMKSALSYEIVGLTDYDFMALDKQFRQGKRSSYKLDDVAEDELDQKKLDHGYNTFKEFYTADWDLFIKYNIQDVRLIVNLEDKIGYINQAITLSYKCHCLFKNNFGTTTKVEAAVYNFLYKKNIIMIDRKVDKDDKKIPGAFVTQAEDLKRGFCHWIIDLDVASLYPSLMRGMNISYETKIGVVKSDEHILSMGDDKLVTIVNGTDKEVNAGSLKKLIKLKGYHVSANNVIFENIRMKKGILVEMLDMWYAQRKADQKLSSEYRDQAIVMFDYATNKTGKFEISEKGIVKLVSEDVFNEYSEAMRKSGIHYNLQWSCKILLNSVYGCLASSFSRFHDRDCASAITLSGQDIIKKNGNVINDYFNKEVFGHEKVKKFFSINEEMGDSDVLRYQDTDSVDCLSIIQTDQGKYSIGELYDKYMSLGTSIIHTGHELVNVEDKNLKCLTYDEVSKKALMGDIKNLVRHKVSKKKWSVSVECRSLILTEDHGCVVIRDGELIRLKPVEIVLGDKLVYIHENVAYEIENYQVECIGEFEDEYVYDIEMSDNTNHTFFANDILIHNSCYLSFDTLMDKMNVDSKDKTRLKVTKFLAKLAMSKLEVFSEEYFPLKYNAKNTIFWDQELIARTGIWCQPKKYACYILEEKGKTPKDPLMVKGLDIVRSSIPNRFRKKIKTVLEMLMTGSTVPVINDFIMELYKDFKTWPVIDIAIPSSCNNLAKYTCSGVNFISGTPQHMRAAVAFNYYLKSNNLKQYDTIKERDKFKMLFLYKNSEFMTHTIGFNDKIPLELDFEKYVNREEHFERGFIKPLDRIFDAIQWNFPETKNATGDIDDLFE